MSKLKKTTGPKLAWPTPPPERPLPWLSRRAVQKSCTVEDVHDRVLRFEGGIIEVEIAPHLVAQGMNGSRIQIEMRENGGGIVITGVDDEFSIDPLVANKILLRPRKR